MSDITDSLDAMTGSNKRVRIMDAQTVIKHPEAVKQLVSEIAESRGVFDSVIWREAMAEYLTKRGYKR
jgi:predicted transcriptional regulator